MLPEAVVAPLQEHLQRVKRLHERGLAQGYGSVYLPFALERKYPNADREWIWQYVFPSERLSKDPRSGVVRRHHVDESGLQKAVREAARLAGIEIQHVHQQRLGLRDLPALKRPVRRVFRRVVQQDAFHVAGVLVVQAQQVGRRLAPPVVHAHELARKSTHVVLRFPPPAVECWKNEKPGFWLDDELRGPWPWHPLRRLGP